MSMIANHKLKKLLAKRIASGLKRKSITKVSDWARMYRVMGQPFPGKWSFDHHPWLLAMHDCQAEMMIGMKAAQMGFTETALNIALKAIDIDGQSVMYILPASKPDASDFSSSRFDPALEMSPHLSRLFTNVKNVHHKRAGNANLYLRGSRSRSQLKSVPVALMIFDEVDEMKQKNIPLALERMSGQLMNQWFGLSTPTIDGFGIDKHHKKTTQREYSFHCPHCSRMTFLDNFEDNLVITADDERDKDIENSYYICKECGHKLDHETKQEWLHYDNCIWVPKHANRGGEGFQINQMYSMTVTPGQIAKSVLKAEYSPEEETELYNSKLGRTHTVEGARVENEHIEACMEIGGHLKQEHSRKDAFVTMGIDIGKWIHFEINEWYFDNNMMTHDINLMAKSKLIVEQKVRKFEELDMFMNLYGVNCAVIDAQPEKREAEKFANRFYGRVHLCFYARGVYSKFINQRDNCEALEVSVDRTSWLDISLGRIIGTRMMLPRDLSLEYRNHIKSLVRIYRKDADDNPVGAYVKEDNAADHFAHAHNYAEIALPLGLGLAQSKNVEEPV